MSSSTNSPTENVNKTNVIKHEDCQALIMLYDKYAPSLLGAITGIVHDEKTAEEVLRKTFLLIWKNSSTFEPGKKPSFAWMYKIARHTALQTVQSKENFKLNQNQKSINIVIKDSVNRADGEDKLENPNPVEGKDTALYYVYYRGYSCTEAAAALKISIDELKIRIATELRQCKG